MALKKSKVLECIHHWVIEIANGSRSVGTCLKCKTNRMFNNSIEKEAFWLNPDRLENNAKV